jgi:hypothetical protein
MIRTAAVIATSFALGACTTINNKQISPETSAQLQGKTVALTSYKTPDFVAFSAGKAAFAILGAAAMISEGNAIVQQNNIEDPAIAIGKGLQDKLKAAKNVAPATAPIATESDDLSSILSKSSGAQYILDYQTLNWMFNYYPTDWSHYKVTYGGRLRLIDVVTKSVVAESGCSAVQGDDKNPPTKDQLLDNNAQLLKSYLAKAASDCVDVLARDVLKL